MTMHSEYFSLPFPTIELSEITLREICDYDAQDYFNYMSKAEMRNFLTEANSPSTTEQALEKLRYWGGLFRHRRSFYWGITTNTNKLVGTAGFNTISIQNARAEISYDLDPTFWGQGVMLKSIKAIIRFADGALNLTRIQATVITDNERSIKVLERCGFINKGMLKKYEVIDEVHKDYYMYARVR